MKKVVIGILALFIAIASGCFFIKSSINNKIESKINELNANGFFVTYEKENVFLKTKGSGKIQVAYPTKAIEYLLSQKEESELKKSFEQISNIFDEQDKEKILEGLTFEYEFTLHNLNSKLNLNLYLTQLSNITMYELGLEETKATASLNSLQELLKNKAIKINIDEKRNYKLDDFSMLLGDVIFTLRGLNGSDNKLNIPLLKLTQGSNSLNSNLSFENLNLFYNEASNKSIDSKLDIGNIEFSDDMASSNLKNLNISSYSVLEAELLKGDTKISIDEFVYKNKDSENLIEDGLSNINLKRTSIEFAFDKLPYNKYQELLNLTMEQDTQLENEEFNKRFKELLDEVSKSAMTLNSKGEANSYEIADNKYFEKLKYSANFELNKEIATIKEIENLNDLISVLKVTIDLDTASAQNITNLSKENLAEDKQVIFVDTQDANFKRFEIELKDKSLFANNKKLLGKEELDIFKKDSSNFYTQDEIDEVSNLSYSYELINKDLLRVNFKYKTALESLSSGGISVSLPQLKDNSSIKSFSSKTFDELTFYKKDDNIYSGLLEENVKADYLMIEGWDEKWSDINVEKEFSIDIDLSLFEEDILEINLRGYSTDAQKENYELVPTQAQSYTKDQQAYPVRIADIDLQEIKNQQ